MGLYFTPVINSGDDLILEYHRYCFFNPTGSPPGLKKLKELQKNPENYGDSGGYQLYNRNKIYYEGKGEEGCLVIVGYGIRKRNDQLILDPIDLCRKFKKYNITYGFTLDNPLSDYATEKEYKEKLIDSYKYAEMMFKYRDTLCPDTNFIIPLHYLTKDHLAEYYNKMSALNPVGYAIPVRGTNNWDDFVCVADCLCFLQNEGAQVIHLFGSCRAEIIVLGAVAMGLRMFTQISFDSTSWRTFRYRRYRYRYLDPKTLTQKTMPDDIVRINLPDKIWKQYKIDKSLQTTPSKKKLILLHNALAVEYYRKNIINIAININNLKRYVKTQKHLKTQRRRLLFAIKIMEASVMYGYDFVEKHFGFIWY